LLKAILRKYNIQSGKTEAYNQHQNRAEQRIADLKELGFLIQSKEGVPYDEWDDELLHACDLRYKRALQSLNWRTPHELVFGETPDISVFKQFRFWEPVRYTTPGISFPDNPDQAGRFIGIAWSTGDILTYKIWVDEAILEDSRYVVVERSAVVSDRGDNLKLNEKRTQRAPISDEERESPWEDTEIDDDDSDDKSFPNPIAWPDIDDTYEYTMPTNDPVNEYEHDGYIPLVEESTQ
jgi:hypothetical protein